MRIFLTLFLFSLLASCGPTKKDHHTTPGRLTQKRATRLLAPKHRTVFSYADSVDLTVKVKNPDTLVSLQILIDGKPLQDFSLEKPAGRIPASQIGYGEHMVSYQAQVKNGRKESRMAQILILSENPPHNYSFEVIRSMPHKIDHYTQGFFIHDEYFYEGTGQRGQSKLVKMKLADAEIVQEKAIESRIFGEGICLFNNSIYQLSWTSGEAFVYDLNFERTGTRSYTGEGWGICAVDSELVTSNGTSELSFRDPETFKVLRKLKVVDNRSDLNNLNELEYINGYIYANVYQSMLIAKIDAKTGVVDAMIDLRGILESADMHSSIDVLNGIAWNGDPDRIYVTGKNWPKIFEIRLIDKSADKPT